MKAIHRLFKTIVSVSLVTLCLVSAVSAQDRAAVEQRLRVELAKILKKDATQLSVDKQIARGIGGLIGRVAPQEFVVMKGPWEQASPGLSGELLFLKGDRLLEVY